MAGVKARLYSIMVGYEVRWHKRMETIVKPELCYDLYGNKITNIYMCEGLKVSYNLKKMLDWAFSAEYWFDKVNGKEGNIVKTASKKALQKLTDSKEVAETYDAPNGHGTYEDCKNFLCDLNCQAEKYGNLICEISR